MNVKWKKIWARAYCLLLGYYYGNAFGEPNRFLVCKNKLFVPDGNLYASYVDEQEFNRLVKKFTAYLLVNGIHSYSRQYEHAFRSSVGWAKKLVPSNVAKLTNGELVEKIRQFHAYFQPYTTLQYTAFVALEGPGRQVEQFSQRYPNPQAVLGWIATPYRLTKITKARLELLTLLAHKQANEKKLQRYVAKYNWMPLNDLTHQPLTLSALKNQIKAIRDPQAEKSRILAFHSESLRSYRRFLKTIQDPKQKKLIEIVHCFSYLKEMRDDYRRQVYLRLQPLFAEAGKRLRLKPPLVCFLTAPEIMESLQSGRPADARTAITRKKAYSLAVMNGKIKIYDFDISKKYLRNRTSLTKMARGQTAFTGQVRGRAVIINDPDEFKKFKKGGILITAMTHPEFLPIMKIAKGIVTNEGGITCHAAIVSRELGIPCIIGTKTATKIFRDGDLVEVDATRGIVKLLKKA